MTAASDDQWLTQTIQLAWSHQQQGRLADAESLCRQVLARQPDFPSALHLLGVLALQAGRAEQAAELIGCAASLDPNHFRYQNDLALALQASDRVDEALATLQNAVRLNPTDADVHYNLGRFFAHRGKVDEAIRSYRRAIELRPNHEMAICNLGNMLKDAGQLSEAIACYRRAIELHPGRSAYLDNVIFALQYDPAFNHELIEREHELWRERFEKPLASFVRPHQNDRSPDRRPLRVGYVSAHFFLHAESYFVLPLLEAHDRDEVGVHCYSSVIWPDEITARFQRAADRWHVALRLSDAELAEQIRSDKIDVLIDLTMHMGDTRLSVFARRPAPVQFSWLAYPGTTGLTSIDARLTDRFLDPIGADESRSSERPIRLPDCWCCYDPITSTPDPGTLPADQNHFVTFGCLNNECKTNDRVLELWSRVLQQVPGSRLVLMQRSEMGRQRVLQFFEARGIERSRIEFVPFMARDEYLQLYRRIDLALDTFPYNGITTTCDALWMGVPIVTLVGEVPQMRAGLGILTTLGLEEFAATSAEEFVRTAVALARDRDGLAEHRRTLRARMSASPLMDAKRFARNVEAAYQEQWRRWCGSETK